MKLNIMLAKINGTLPSTEHRVKVSAGSPQGGEGGGKDTRRPGETKPTCTAQAEPKAVVFLAMEGESRTLLLLKNMSA